MRGAWPVRRLRSRSSVRLRVGPTRFEGGAARSAARGARLRCLRTRARCPYRRCRSNRGRGMRRGPPALPSRLAQRGRESTACRVPPAPAVRRRRRRRRPGRSPLRSVVRRSVRRRLRAREAGRNRARVRAPCAGAAEEERRRRERVARVGPRVPSTEWRVATVEPTETARTGRHRRRVADGAFPRTAGEDPPRQRERRATRPDPPRALQRRTSRARRSVQASSSPGPSEKFRRSARARPA